MSISIYSSSSSHISINLLELASSILKNFKFGDTYSMDMEIDFDSHFITDGGDIRDRYLISQGGFIIDHRYEYEITHEEDSAGVISEEEIKIEARPYSDKDFKKIVCCRIERGLEEIGGTNIGFIITGNKIITTFLMDFLNQNEYRSFLLYFIETKINRLNPVMSLDLMKKGLVNTIRKLSEQFESNTIILSETDITITINSKDELRNQSESDSIKIFECYIPYLMKELLIYTFMYEGKIESFEVISIDQYRLVLSEETSVFKPRVVGPIYFDKQNGVITLHGDEVGILNKDTRYYQFFEVLYDNPNILLDPSSICKKMKIGKIESTDNIFIKGILKDLIKSNNMNKSFIIEFIKTRNSHYILNNR